MRTGTTPVYSNVHGARLPPEAKTVEERVSKGWNVGLSTGPTGTASIGKARPRRWKVWRPAPDHHAKTKCEKQAARTRAGSPTPTGWVTTSLPGLRVLYGESARKGTPEDGRWRVSRALLQVFDIVSPGLRVAYVCVLSPNQRAGQLVGEGERSNCHREVESRSSTARERGS